METSASKKMKHAWKLMDLLCIHFGSNAKWIVCYFCIVLECDSPILEAILFTSYAGTQVNNLGCCVFLEALDMIIVRKIQKLHIGGMIDRKFGPRRWNWKHLLTGIKFHMYFGWQFNHPTHTVKFTVVRHVGTEKEIAKFTFGWKPGDELYVIPYNSTKRKMIPWQRFSPVLKENLQYLFDELCAT